MSRCQMNRSVLFNVGYPLQVQADHFDAGMWTLDILRGQQPRTYAGID